MLSNWYTKFSSQPHQPFFTSGIILLILFMALLFGFYSNRIVLDGSVVDFHVYPMLFIIFIQFFLGFLFVVFPKFLMQAAIAPTVYMQQFFVYLLGSILFLVGLFTSPLLQIGAMFILFGIQCISFWTLLKIQKKSIVNNKNDTFWVLVAFASGLVSHLLFIVFALVPQSAFILKPLAIHAGFYLFLFALIFTISQRMIPQFTGFKIQDYVINKTNRLVAIVYCLLVLKVFLLMAEHEGLNILIDIPLLIFFARELWRWKLPITKVSAIIWVLYLALFWIPIGFFLSASMALVHLLGWVDFGVEKIVVHTFALGYFTTMLIGFGTRVVLGHSGRTPTADKTAIAMFIFLQLIVLVRLFASVASNFNFDYIFWINHSALLLIVALLAWSVKYLWILIKGT